jgi:hypothetical protein
LKSGEQQIPETRHWMSVSLKSAELQITQTHQWVSVWLPVSVSGE